MSHSKRLRKANYCMIRNQEPDTSANLPPQITLSIVLQSDNNLSEEPKIASITIKSNHSNGYVSAIYRNQCDHDDTGYT